MATAQGALDFMRANLGLGEDPDGSNHNWLTEWAELGDQPWCAITVSRALNEAWGDPDRWQVPGVGSTYAWGTAYVPALRQHFLDAGLFDHEPRVGDVVIYGWTFGSDGDHTGLVEQVVGDGTIVALEGNQGNHLVRIRRPPNLILGFGHPPYDDPAPTTPDRPEEDPPMFTFWNADHTTGYLAIGDKVIWITGERMAKCGTEGVKDLGDCEQSFLDQIGAPEHVVVDK